MSDKLTNITVVQLVCDVKRRFLRSAAVVAIFFSVMTGLEWFRWYRDMPPDPQAVTAVTLLFWIFAIYRFFRLRPQVRRLKQGRDGEKAVGQYLDHLREKGIPALDFNVGYQEYRRVNVR